MAEMNPKPKYNQKRINQKERPMSSRFPPLVRRSPEHNIRERSSSFDYSFTHSKENVEHNSSSTSDNQKETSSKIALNEVLHESSHDLFGGFPRASNHELNKLKNENQILKSNFLKMSRIIQRHSRLIAKKDEIILKLQQQNNSKYSLPSIHSHSRNIHIQNGHDNFLSPSTSNSNSNDSEKMSEEIQLKQTEFSLKFRQIYDSMVSDLSQHLTQFMKVIEDMQRFLENNLKFIDKNNSINMGNNNNKDFETKFHVLNEEYSKIKNNYEELIKHHDQFELFIEFMTKSFQFKPKKDLNSSESIVNLKQYFTELLSKNQLLNNEIESIQNSHKNDENYCFLLIECLSEVELELELLGRNPKTLNKVIEKFEQKLESIQQRLSQTYFESMNKILIQIYKNHLKWFQFVNKPSKSTQTWIAESSTEEDEEIIPNDNQLICCQMSHTLRNENLNSISEEIKSNFNDSEDSAFDEWDIESINYILMAKYFDYNLKSNLEVLEEVEEENSEGNDNESNISYEDSVFEDIIECSEKCLKSSENSNNNTVSYNNNIESEVKQVLNEILDEIDKQFSEETIKNNLVNIGTSNEKDMKNWIVCHSGSSQPNIINESDMDESNGNIIENKAFNFDSDFVSDDLSSSPETVMVYPNEQGHKIKRSADTFGKIKDLTQKQTENTFESQTNISEEKNNQKYESKEKQYLNDELKAWKEMVEQQKVIMEKIRNELELQQKLNNEKDKTIEALKNGSRSESLAEMSDNQMSIIEQNSDKFVDILDDECKTLTDDLELNHIFDDKFNSDEEDVEVIEFNDSLIPENRFLNSDKKSPDISIQEVWIKPNDYLERNYVSDESSGYSVCTANTSSLSVPEELLTSNRTKVFIPFSHEGTAVRRHSCQGRLARYGDHPRKKKLELKQVDIIFQKQKQAKEVGRTTRTNNKK